MDHDFTSASRFCHSCGVDGWEVASGPEAFICPGPKPAGNTGRHEDSILWDRLRADLNNLGAAYGELPTTIVTPGTWTHHPQESIEWSAVSDPTSWAPTVTISEEQALERWPEAVIPAGEMVTQASIQMAMNKLWLDHLNGDSGSEIITGVVGKEAAGWGCEPDYDAILLAARKKREAQNALGPSKACVPTQATDVGGLGHPLSKAMDRPLSFSKRIGWKPGDCE